MMRRAFLSKLMIFACCAAVAGCGQRGMSALPSFGSGVGAFTGSSSGPVWTPIGPTEPTPGMLWWWNPIRDGNSGKFNAVAINPRRPRTMYLGAGTGHNCEVVSEGGIFKTLDGGSTWAPMDNGLSDRYVNDLWIDPKNPNHLVAATELTGLFYSRSAGATWRPVLTPVSALALASTASGTIYAGTSAGLYSSRNGRIWSAVSSVPATTVTAIGVAGNAVFVGTIKGVVYTQLQPNAPFVQGGTIPTQPCGGGSGSSSSYSGVGSPQTAGIGQIAIDPLDVKRAFATASAYAPSSSGSSGYQADLYKTSDGGVTWKPVRFPVVSSKPYSGTSLAESIAFSLRTPHTLYVGGDASASIVQHGVWTMVPNPYGRFNNLTGDTRRLYVYPNGSNGERIIAASDQGVWSVPQFTSTVGERSLSAGISSNIVNDLAVSTSGSATIAAVTLQDFTPMHTQDVNGSQTAWQFYRPNKASDEDGSVEFAPAPNGTNCILANSVALALSNDGCAKFYGGKRAYTSMFGDSSEVITFSQTQAGLVYLVNQSYQVYASQNYGRSPVQQSSWPLLSRVVAGPATTSRADGWLYGLPSGYCFGSSSTYGPCSDLRYSSDGGRTWYVAHYTSGTCSRAAAVAVNSVSPNIVVLACFNQTGVAIFQSTDHGKDFAPTTYAVQSDLRARGNDYEALYRSMTPSSDSLKTNAALAFFAYPTDLEYNPSPPSGQNPALILTTSRGGAMSTDDGTTWTSIDGNAISTCWMRIAWANGNAFIGTRGQGVLMAPMQPSSATR